MARFEHEAKGVAALFHPNVLGIFDFGSEGGIVYAVTELPEGETLRAQLAAGALTVRKAVDYAAQMAQGLAAAILDPAENPDIHIFEFQCPERFLTNSLHIHISHQPNGLQQVRPGRGI